MIEFIAKYWIEVLFGAITTCSIAGYRKIANRFNKGRDETKSMKDGIKAILHHMIIQQCKKHLDEQYCTVEDLKELEYLYEPYEALNGNGTAKNLYDKVKELPNRSLQ